MSFFKIAAVLLLGALLVQAKDDKKKVQTLKIISTYPTFTKLPPKGPTGYAPDAFTKEHAVTKSVTYSGIGTGTISLAANCKDDPLTIRYDPAFRSVTSTGAPGTVTFTEYIQLRSGGKFKSSAAKCEVLIKLNGKLVEDSKLEQEILFVRPGAPSGPKYDSDDDDDDEDDRRR